MDFGGRISGQLPAHQTLRRSANPSWVPAVTGAGSGPNKRRLTSTTSRAQASVEYAAIAGNLGAQMWTRDVGEGCTEVVTVSWWESRTAIEGFAGSDIDIAVFYPEDDGYLVDRETTVRHYEVPQSLTG